MDQEIVKEDYKLRLGNLMHHMGHWSGPSVGCTGQFERHATKLIKLIKGTERKFFSVDFANMNRMKSLS